MTRGGRGGGVGGGNGAGSLIFVFALAAVMIGGSAGVWLAGAAGGILRGPGPVVLGPSQATDVLARLPRHLGDPAAAWPISSRGDLPGRTGMTAALIAALAVLVVLAVAVLVVVQRVQRGGHGGRRRGARWARRGDLRELRVRRPERRRVILGRHEGALVAAEPRASVMVVAPSQAGKTTGLVVPALLEWDGPVLATSVKGDLTHDTYAARSTQGDVRVFDPTGSTGLQSAGWSPVAVSTTWEAARRTAARLLQVGERAGNSPDESFWRPAAARYLAPLLLAAAHERATCSPGSHAPNNRSPTTRYRAAASSAPARAWMRFSRYGTPTSGSAPRFCRPRRPRLTPGRSRALPRRPTRPRRSTRSGSCRGATRSTSSRRRRTSAGCAGCSPRWSPTSSPPHRQRLELDLGSRPTAATSNRSPPQPCSAGRQGRRVAHLRPAGAGLAGAAAVVPRPRPQAHSQCQRQRPDAGRRDTDAGVAGPRVSDDRYFPDELPAEWPEGIVGAEEQGVRVFWLAAATMPDLVARLALVLGEHMADGDELHVTYNAMQSGFHHFPPQRAGSQWTDLHFEYSAFVVLRPRDPGPPSLQ